MSSLNTDEIARELESLGAVLRHSPMYAYTFHLPISGQPICIKRGKGGRTMRTRPLLVLPQHRDLPHWEALRAALGGPGTDYRNADLHGFPLAATGQSKTGIAFDVPSVQALRTAVRLLEGTMSAPEDALLRQVAVAELADDPSCSQLAETVRQQLVDARIGQGGFRRALMAYWDGSCALTGCSLAQVLVASHIKPWAGSSNQERLDPFNGLLLAAHVDRLFDRGLISFANDGRLLYSAALPHAELERLGLQGDDRRLKQLAPAHLPYLTEHRRVFGFISN